MGAGGGGEQTQTGSTYFYVIKNSIFLIQIAV